MSRSAIPMALENSCKVSPSSSTSSTRTTPYWAKTAEATASFPAIDAVCDAAVFCPYSERPIFRITIGLPAPPAPLQELPALAESLHDGADNPDPLVVHHMVDEVGDVQVGFVAG